MRNAPPTFLCCGPRSGKESPGIGHGLGTRIRPRRTPVSSNTGSKLSIVGASRILAAASSGDEKESKADGIARRSTVNLNVLLGLGVALGLRPRRDGGTSSMKSAKLILLAGGVAIVLFSVSQTASAQVYSDHHCASPNTYGYYGDGYYAPPYDDGPYASAPGPYAYPDRSYGPAGGYIGYSAPYPDSGYSTPYGAYAPYGDPYAYDRYGYGRGYRQGYSGGHHGGYNRYATPYGVHEDHVRRRLNLFPFPHIDRRVVHHTHR